jgi:hypothetical protein
MESSAFEKELKPLFDLYLEVKAIIAIAEEIDPYGKTYAGPLNEMRNVLDHIMRAFQYPDRVQHEYHEAKEHLYRAGYDAWAMLCMHLGQKIEEDLSSFSIPVITAVIPTYYTDYKPKLIQVKADLADIRVHKRIDPDVQEKSFGEYLPVVKGLFEMSKHVSSVVPDLQKEHSRLAADRVGRKWGRALQIAGPIVGALVAFSLVWFLGRSDGAQQSSPPSHQVKAAQGPK